MPFPPYIVPKRANSGWFWLIGRSCPLHSAQPFGGKLNDMILISPRNGEAIGDSLLVPRAYGVGQAAPPTKPPPVVGKAAVALPVGMTPLLVLMKTMTAVVSPAAPA